MIVHYVTSKGTTSQGLTSEGETYQDAGRHKFLLHWLARSGERRHKRQRCDVSSDVPLLRMTSQGVTSVLLYRIRHLRVVHGELHCSLA
jgi:hypothetical protein